MSAEASIGTPRNRTRQNTPARGGEPGVRDQMLEPPARAQGRQAAQAGQDGGAKIGGGEDEDGEEGPPPGQDLPPPPNGPNPVPRIARMTLMRRRQPKCFWLLMFLILLLLLLVGCIFRSMALHHSQLDPAPNSVAAPPMTRQEWADYGVEAEKAKEKMREKARMAGLAYEDWPLF